MPTILALSGWAQHPKSLNSIFSNSSSFNQIINFDYSQFNNFEDCLLAIKNLKIKPEIITGWSLGGQIASRLIAENLFNPRLLILIATPFQFVKSEAISVAMTKKTFDIFKDNFIKNSNQTLEKFSLLMMLNDKRVKELAGNIYINQSNYDNLAFWLEELGRFSCYNLKFDNFPETLIFHGRDDLVVNYRQAQIFYNKISHSKLEILSKCGHCPQISNLSQMQQIIVQKL